ncbi:FAD-dependent oxidoreductase [Erythrobacter aurantius]|uniref:FAD-dependent oxidoreductase n=1 Tax=Erythrobacter aurantius TaxID=2909249 RepID=UPI002079ED9B|nr:FAD-dependent oxidoreductase [Erythrobacter aurantius]
MTHANETSTSDVDVIVVGSGAAALAAACRVHDLGASVRILEKTDMIGGNSATSGGGIWVPNNERLAAAGIEDSEDDAFSYLRTVIPREQISDETIRTYIDSAPKMIEYLREIGVPYEPVQHYPDYYPSIPGWKPGGRTMDCAPLDGRKLGDDLHRLRQMPHASKAFGRINLSITEVSKVQAVAPGWQKIAGKALVRYAADIAGRLKGKRDRRLCMGEALIGRLLLAVKERGINLQTNMPVAGLIRDADRVTGVIVDGGGGRRHKLTARRGVIVASGGFEKSNNLRRDSLANPTKPEWSAGSPGNTGDLIEAGREVGVATGLMHEAWWAPVVMWGDRPVVLFFEKSKPGMVMVNRAGQRFMNEAITYNSYGKCLYGEGYDIKDRVPAFIIFDRTYRENYMFGGLLQASMSPDWMNAGAFGRGGMLHKAPTLRALAAKLGIDADGLEASAARMGEFARTGVDEDFGRGSDEHDQQYGDADVSPNPCLGPIVKPPFYGAAVYPGDIGTKGGLVIDNNGQVLDDTGTPIPGLFAAGNTTASIMGDKYPGAGCTLGPALTMAFRGSNRLMQTNAA